MINISTLPRHLDGKDILNLYNDIFPFGLDVVRLDYFEDKKP